MSGEFWAAIVGAIVGSLSGGAITWFLQSRQDRQQKLDRDKGLARSLIFKMMRIHSDFHGFKSHVEEMSANAEQQGLDVGWRSFRAIGNLPDRIKFSAEEMGYLISLEDLDLFNRILSLDVIHSSTIGVFELYKERRITLTDMLRTPNLEGTVGTAVLSDEEQAFFAPKAVELDLLVADIRARVDSDADSSRSALTDLAVAVRKTLGEQFSLAFD